MKKNCRLTILLLLTFFSLNVSGAGFPMAIKHGLQFRESLWITLGSSVYDAADGDALTRDLIQRMPETGNYEEMGAPTLLTLISKTSDLCKIFVQSQEQNKRSSQTVEDWTAQTALLLWNRSLDPVEKDLFAELSENINEPILAKTLTCTAMLSSAQFIKN